MKPWVGVWNATIPGSNCIGFDHASFKVIGQEDCLYLNVYTPKVSKTHPDGYRWSRERFYERVSEFDLSGPISFRTGVFVRHYETSARFVHLEKTLYKNCSPPHSYTRVHIFNGANNCSFRQSLWPSPRSRQTTAPLSALPSVSLKRRSNDAR